MYILQVEPSRLKLRFMFTSFDLFILILPLKKKLTRVSSSIIDATLSFHAALQIKAQAPINKTKSHSISESTGTVNTEQFSVHFLDDYSIL